MSPALSPSPHQSLNHEGRWGTRDDFTTNFLYFALFSTALWDLANSRPVHSLMLSSHLFSCLPCLPPHFTVPCKMVLARPDEQETCPYHFSLCLFTIVRSSSSPHDMKLGYIFKPSPANVEMLLSTAMKIRDIRSASRVFKARRD